MKDIKQLWREALIRRHERHFTELYLVVDLHGTLIRPTRYTKILCGEECEIANRTKIETYPFAIETLREILSNDHVKLILWTSSKDNWLKEYIKGLEDSGVHVSFVNENPDFYITKYADFTGKFCFDVLFDDKAGFDPEHDWEELYNYIVETDWVKFYENLDKSEAD